MELQTQISCIFCGKEFDKKHNLQQHSATKKSCSELIDRSEINIKLFTAEKRMAEIDKKNKKINMLWIEADKKNKDLEHKNTNIEHKNKDLEHKNTDLECKIKDLECKIKDLEAMHHSDIINNTASDVNSNHSTYDATDIECRDNEYPVMTHISYIYLLQEREFTKTYESIYKIGKTHQKNLIRYKKYPKGSLLLYQIMCTDCDAIERILLEKFKQKYIQRLDIGLEYFEGSYKQMIDDISSVCKFG